MRRQRSSQLRPTFLITRDGDVEVFKTPAEAVAWVEAVDVEAGEYADCFSIEGERLHLTVMGERVELRPTGLFDPARLSSQLRLLAERNAYEGDDPDPRIVANEVFAHEWNRRWPRWPTWLDKRLHGAAPPQVDPPS